MPSMLAPYTNSMRLGQGFNSFTQQICLDRAVLPDNPTNRRKEQELIKLSYGGANVPEEEHGPLARSGQNEHDGQSSNTDSIRAETSQPQIVTYFSKFVENISDVTDSMNISGSLAIKTAQVAGSISGAYIDSNKFKTSDINFHLQVRVKNEDHEATEYSIFNKIASVKDTEFTNVYGDCFISGWETGGELNAVISVKVLDKSKIFEVKAALEAQINTGAISGGAKGAVEINNSNLASKTQTTITVHWSGGGRIKLPGEQWTIETLKTVAAAFPDMVAITPQRTYAILTKYTNLESFHRHKSTFSPLSYENAGVYTNSLMESYMDYKSLWKQISNATTQLETNQASIEMAQPSQEICNLAVVKPLPSNEITTQFKPAASEALMAAKGDQAPTQVQSATQNQLSIVPSSAVKIDTEKQEIRFSVFPPSFAGLIQARQICRWEMGKIVNEVDLVTKNPDIATDGHRDLYFLNPLVLKQLLPVVRSIASQDAIQDVKNPNAALLLGFKRPEVDSRIAVNICELQQPLEQHDARIVRSSQKHGHRSEHYRMIGCAGEINNLPPHAEWFDALDYLDPTWRPQSLAVWVIDNKLVGVSITYTNANKKEHGNTKGQPTYSLALNFDTTEVITEVQVDQGRGNKPEIYNIRAATSRLEIWDPSARVPSTDGKSSEEPKLTVGKTLSWSKVDRSQWSLRGFFGFNDTTRIISLGTIWGRDTFVPVPTTAIALTPAAKFLQLPVPFQKKIQQFAISYPLHMESFFFGDSICTYQLDDATSSPSGNETGEKTYFNSLNDIYPDWTPRRISFSQARGTKHLSSMTITYSTGIDVTHGYVPAANGESSTSKDLSDPWSADIAAPVTHLKFTAGQLQDASSSTSDDGNPIFINSVEFIHPPVPSNPSSTSNSNTTTTVAKIGELMPWPKDNLAIQFHGYDYSESKNYNKYITYEQVEVAPGLYRAGWSWRGFYGEVIGKRIVRLGPIWGRG